MAPTAFFIPWSNPDQMIILSEIRYAFFKNHFIPQDDGQMKRKNQLDAHFHATRRAVGCHPNGPLNDNLAAISTTEHCQNAKHAAALFRRKANLDAISSAARACLAKVASRVRDLQEKRASQARALSVSLSTRQAACEARRAVLAEHEQALQAEFRAHTALRTRCRTSPAVVRASVEYGMEDKQPAGSFASRTRSETTRPNDRPAIYIQRCWRMYRISQDAADYHAFSSELASPKAVQHAIQNERIIQSARNILKRILSTRQMTIDGSTAHSKLAQSFLLCHVFRHVPRECSPMLKASTVTLPRLVLAFPNTRLSSIRSNANCHCLFPY